MDQTSPSGGPLSGQRALVTGGSSGIGARLCDRLLALGAAVVSLSLDTRPDGTHPALTQHRVDLRDVGAVRSIASTVCADGAVDVLINNAGHVIHRPLEDVTDDDFDCMFDLHVRTAIALAQAVTPGMKQRRHGRIVNVASRAILGLGGRTTYAASKAAVASLTRTWALELGPHGITVNTVSPGPIATPMLDRDLPPDSAPRAALAASLPLRRLGTADDIARAVLFFVEPENTWITGQNLFVCGGASVSASVAL